MQLVRTTLRLDKSLKEEAKELALKEKTTLKEVFNKALSDFVMNKARNRAKKMVIHAHDLGVNLNNLTRDDIYD